jgi:hypothetical protein
MFAPAFHGDPGTTSLKYDSDFFISKPTTDILLHGHAYAPNGQAVAQVDVGMRIGSLTKILRVTGNRVYRHMVRLSPGEPEPFVALPITYERAQGGHELRSLQTDRPRFDARNPVGVGFAPLPGMPVPNVSYASSDPLGIPAGFSPIASHWQPRVRYAGTYDEAWQSKRFPLYPVDLDDRFFLCSPEDQRPATHLRGGERVHLANLTPGGRLSFVLPRLAFRFETEFRARPTLVHRGTLHSVILEPDLPRIVMVWHTALPAHADVLRLNTTFISLLRVLNPSPGSVPFGLMVPDDEVEEQPA